MPQTWRVEAGTISCKYSSDEYYEQLYLVHIDIFALRLNLSRYFITVFRKPRDFISKAQKLVFSFYSLLNTRVPHLLLYS